MKKFWNALLYGDAKTRKCIGSVIVFSVLAVIFIVLSGVFKEFNIFILGMIAAMVAILISQTFTLVDDTFVAEVTKAGEKNTIHSVSVQGKTDKEATWRLMTEKKSEKKADGYNELQDINRYDRYNQKTMKSIKKKYYVKKDHRPIIIDSCESYHIRQCPAFIWRAHSKVFILLLEKEPRRISISREWIHNMGYKPGVRVDKDKEYLAFQKDTLITRVFSEFLPDYHEAKVKNDPLKIKNLYTIYPDICLSNRSAYQVMDLLLLNFMPKDKITESDKINGFFKRIYAANILFKDKVYSIIEYKDAVETSLKEMCYAEISRREYMLTLENLYTARLISKQYVTHYSAMWDKINGD